MRHLSSVRDILELVRFAGSRDSEWWAVDGIIEERGVRSMAHSLTDVCSGAIETPQCCGVRKRADFK